MDAQFLLHSIWNKRELKFQGSDLFFYEILCIFTKAIISWQVLIYGL